jgi:hypothetical protein
MDKLIRMVRNHSNEMKDATVREHIGLIETEHTSRGWQSNLLSLSWAMAN